MGAWFRNLWRKLRGQHDQPEHVYTKLVVAEEENPAIPPPEADASSFADKIKQARKDHYRTFWWRWWKRAGTFLAFVVAFGVGLSGIPGVMKLLTAGTTTTAGAGLVAAIMTFVFIPMIMVALVPLMFSRGNPKSDKQDLIELRNSLLGDNNQEFINTLRKINEKDDKDAKYSSEIPTPSRKPLTREEIDALRVMLKRYDYKSTLLGKVDLKIAGVVASDKQKEDYLENLLYPPLSKRQKSLRLLLGTIIFAGFAFGGYFALPLTIFIAAIVIGLVVGGLLVNFALNLELMPKLFERIRQPSSELERLALHDNIVSHLPENQRQAWKSESEDLHKDIQYYNDKIAAKKWWKQKIASNPEYLTASQQNEIKALRKRENLVKNLLPEDNVKAILKEYPEFGAGYFRSKKDDSALENHLLGLVIIRDMRHKDKVGQALTVEDIIMLRADYMKKDGRDFEVGQVLTDEDINMFRANDYMKTKGQEFKVGQALTDEDINMFRAGHIKTKGQEFKDTSLEFTDAEIRTLFPLKRKEKFARAIGCIPLILTAIMHACVILVLGSMVPLVPLLMMQIIGVAFAFFMGIGECQEWMGYFDNKQDCSKEKYNDNGTVKKENNKVIEAEFWERNFFPTPKDESAILKLCKTRMEDQDEAKRLAETAVIYQYNGIRFGQLISTLNMLQYLAVFSAGVMGTLMLLFAMPATLAAIIAVAVVIPCVGYRNATFYTKRMAKAGARIGLNFAGFQDDEVAGNELINNYDLDKGRKLVITNAVVNFGIVFFFWMSMITGAWLTAGKVSLFAALGLAVVPFGWALGLALIAATLACLGSFMLCSTFWIDKGRSVYNFFTKPYRALHDWYQQKHPEPDVAPRRTQDAPQIAAMPANPDATTGSNFNPVLSTGANATDAQSTSGEELRPFAAAAATA